MRRSHRFWLFWLALAVASAAVFAFGLGERGAFDSSFSPAFETGR